MTGSIEQRGARMAQTWLKIAVLYLLIGVIFGIVMAGNHQFQYAPVHAHINLLGWASMGLAGVIYWLFPRAGGHWLGLAHFWLHNIGLPIAMASLFLMLGGNPAMERLVALGSLAIVAGVVLFAVNVFVNVKTA